VLFLAVEGAEVAWGTGSLGLQEQLEKEEEEGEVAGPLKTAIVAATVEEQVPSLAAVAAAAVFLLVSWVWQVG
jgi:hypothetical protein